mmetsp:Transcript_8916/g.14468  ORF Transcript_8916/g.14468 Transcript_8916/m.14468 type:complete len:163 (+) Transcript_8916:921-1409(+)
MVNLTAVYAPMEPAAQQGHLPAHTVLQVLIVLRQVWEDYVTKVITPVTVLQFAASALQEHISRIMGQTGVFLRNQGILLILMLRLRKKRVMLEPTKEPRELHNASDALMVFMLRSKECQPAPSALMVTHVPHPWQQPVGKDQFLLPTKLAVLSASQGPSNQQ